VKQLRYTLLSDGSSDRGLLPILTWLLGQHLPAPAIRAEWADLRMVPSPPRALADRISMAVKLHPCDLLFVHRDAERASRSDRVSEIRDAHGQSEAPQFPAVCVVPVRMTEAWLLFNETAIREAAENPGGHVRLALPDLRDIEGLPDPKALLHRLLATATELNWRRRKRFRADIAAQHVTDHISDFSPLRRLAAFSALEQELRQIIREKGW